MNKWIELHDEALDSIYIRINSISCIREFKSKDSAFSHLKSRIYYGLGSMVCVFESVDEIMDIIGDCKKQEGNNDNSRETE